MPTAMVETMTIPKSSLKRKREDYDGNGDSIPKKQQKVTIALPEDNDLFEESLIKANVQDALNQLENDDPEPFNLLASRLALPKTSNEALSSGQVRLVIQAITNVLTKLDSHKCTGMISTLLKLKWSNRDSAFISTYVRFLMVLVSCNPKWWNEVATKIVADFISKDTKPHHQVLEQIFLLVPTASNTIQQIFVANFPHKSDTAKRILRYIKNLLAAAEYCPELQRGVWALILEKTVQLDVELDEEMDEYDDEDDDEESDSEDEPSDDDDDDDDEREETKNIQKDYESDDDESDDDSDDESDEDLGEEVSEYELQPDETKNLAAVRQKLDMIMTHLLNHLQAKFTYETIETEQAVPMFYMLLDLFKQYVLPTHRTRSVQFLIFKICHSHPRLLDTFLVSMIRTALESRENIERRQKAMQYVSSFTARAKGLSRQQILMVVCTLRNWLQSYVDQRENEVDSSSGSMGRFRMFYSASQALFYIFCFRHPLLRKPDEDNTWEFGLDKLFSRMIFTKFNPLKYCKNTVVAMFAHVARQQDAAYCHTKIDQNRKGTGFSSSSRNSSISSITGFLGAKPVEFVALEGYFPFDPMILNQANKFVEDDYVAWEDDGSDSGSDYDYDDDDDEL